MVPKQASFDHWPHITSIYSTHDADAVQRPTHRGFDVPLLQQADWYGRSSFEFLAVSQLFIQIVSHACKMYNSKPRALWKTSPCLHQLYIFGRMTQISNCTKGSWIRWNINQEPLGEHKTPQRISRSVKKSSHAWNSLGSCFLSWRTYAENFMKIFSRVLWCCQQALIHKIGNQFLYPRC